MMVEEAVAPTPEELAPRAKNLPDPVGWRILCAVPEFNTKFDNSVLERPQTVIQQEQFATVVLFVLKLGPDAYKDEKRYPNGPWCKEGDFIIARQYSGTRMRIFEKEFRIINEDQVEAVVQDPRGISRA